MEYFPAYDDVSFSNLPSTESKLLTTLYCRLLLSTPIIDSLLSILHCRIFIVDFLLSALYCVSTLTVNFYCWFSVILLLSTFYCRLFIIDYLLLTLFFYSLLSALFVESFRSIPIVDSYYRPFIVNSINCLPLSSKIMNFEIFELAIRVDNKKRQ